MRTWKDALCNKGCQAKYLELKSMLSYNDTLECQSPMNASNEGQHDPALHPTNVERPMLVCLARA